MAKRYTKAQTALRKKWVAALRSGEYKQTQNRLHRDGKFCCLGVLCDLFDPQGWHTPGHQHFKGCKEFIAEGSSTFPSSTFPPDTVRRAVGISYAQANQLAVENDKGATFEEIAREIKNLRRPDLED